MGNGQWKWGFAAVLLSLATACGQNSTPAGNTAGFVGNTVGGAVRDVQGDTGTGRTNVGRTGIRSTEDVYYDHTKQRVDLRYPGAEVWTRTKPTASLVVPLGWSVRVMDFPPNQNDRWVWVPYDRIGDDVGPIAGASPGIGMPGGGVHMYGPTAMHRLPSGSQPVIVGQAWRPDSEGLYALVAIGSSAAGRVRTLIDVRTNRLQGIFR